jgi:hypothetical protein
LKAVPQVTVQVFGKAGAEGPQLGGGLGWQPDPDTALTVTAAYDFDKHEPVYRARLGIRL